MIAAKKTGFYPFDPHAIESSPFVRDIPVQPEAQRRIARLEIGGQVLNSTAMINSIVRMLQTCPQFTHLCCLPRAGVTYVDYVKDVCKKKLPNGCHFLDRIPCFRRRNGNLYSFD